MTRMLVDASLMRPMASMTAWSCGAAAPLGIFSKRVNCFFCCIPWTAYASGTAPPSMLRTALAWPPSAHAMAPAARDPRTTPSTPSSVSGPGTVPFGHETSAHVTILRLFVSLSFNTTTLPVCKFSCGSERNTACLATSMSTSRAPNVRSLPVLTDHHATTSRWEAKRRETTSSHTSVSCTVWSILSWFAKHHATLQ
ncbi:unnamed protein product [Prorocentrum cordatum]|uniref:Secreted protein n=1 Tax=Prorocentrum cordatum TaxID=2364126 RepID=A0ABN9S9L7_9DINO|nr:unnamed protein product [Polarella glacialis]